MPDVGGIAVPDRDLAELVVRARTLDERLAGVEQPRPSDTATGVPEAGADLVALWTRAYSKGDRESFARRLGWDGLAEEDVRRALSAAVEPTPDLPPWARDLGRVLEGFVTHADATATASDSETVVEAQPPCFSELWTPFVRFARNELERHSGTAADHFAESAQADLARHLVAQLSSLAAVAVFERFDRMRSAEAIATGREPGTDDPSSRTLYRRFLSAMLEGELAPFLIQHATLARGVMRLVDGWVDGMAELYTRLARDVADITRLLAGGHEPGPVVRAVPGLSDRHNCGRQVVALTFSSGLKVVYKPRDLGVEGAFSALLEWLGEWGLDDAPHAPSMVLGPGYGWVEYIDQRPAATAEEVRAYYRRAGALLCLSWVLGGSDLHTDNVVARGDSPVLIDVETLLQPRVSPAAAPVPANAMARAGDKLRSSFMSTGMLSFPQVGADGRMVDIGGLCGAGGHLAATRQRRWEHANTDAMHPRYESAYADEMHNVLYLAGNRQPPEAFTNELAEGFAATYRLLLSHRQELAADDGPLAAFAGRRTRVLFRPSNQYALVQYVLAAPKYQREGVLRGFVIDSLNSALRNHPGRPRLWPLAADERSALERLDIPYFTMPTDSTTISTDSGESIDGHYDASGLERLHSRLESLSEQELSSQINLLRASLLASDSSEAAIAADAAAAEDGPPESGADVRPASERPLVDAAAALADDIMGQAIEGEDGSMTWIAPAYLRTGERTDRGVSYYLHGGASGIALFLAAAARVTGNDDYRAAASAACAPIVTVLDSGSADKLLEYEGIGACNGLGGIVYAMTWIGRLLDDSSFTDTAARVAEFITEERIGSDTLFDVEGGAAGAILGLLALHRATAEGWTLDRAAACGRHLVDSARTGDSGGAAWPGPEGLMLAGFAHGAAGIAHALAHLYRETGELPLLDAVGKAYQYERGVFSPEARNWPLLQIQGASGELERIQMKAWCHGAPGIALARAGTLDLLDDEAIRAELETAIDSTLRIGLSGLDHLCCGNLGRVDVLFTSGRTLRDKGLVGESGGRAAMVLRRAIAQGSYRLRLEDAENRTFQPGFFRGSSGIGYQLLRLARPDDLPSILAFEPGPRLEEGRC